MSQELPRLLYCSDVPPEMTPGNMALYRLLQNYPPQQLLVMLGNVQAYRPDLRLAGPRYVTHQTARFPRLLYTRFAPQYAAWLYRTAAKSAARADNLIAEFKPQAVFTIAHNYTWLVADAISRRHNLPLHLAVWDDFVRQSRLTPKMRELAEPKFAEAYRRAASRLCISPNMAEVFEERYGVKGDVLYPLRGAELPTYDAPPQRVGRNDTQLTFAFAGSVNYGVYARMIGTLAKVLGELGHRLLVFGGISPDVARESGIAGSHVTLFPLLKIEEVQQKMREQVDALFVPMSFASDMELDMRISFPSKLSDYSAVALPLLIWGPQYCSANRWAHENPGAAVVVKEDTPAALADGVRQIATSGARRLIMGELAAAAGRRTFDHSAVTGLLHRKLRESCGLSVPSSGTPGEG